MSRYDAYDNYKPPGIAISKSKMQVLKDSAILSLNEFNRIKQSSFFSPQASTSKLSSVNSVDKFNVQKLNDSSNNTINQNPNIQKALIHKKKIIDYEKAIDRGNNPLFMEKIKIEDPYKVVGGKNNDVVKAFDHLCRKAKVATIWDRQMEERKIMEGMYTKKEKRLDEMMELERLKEIQYIEQREKHLQKSKLEGQKAIIDQIYDNDKERNKKREAIEREKVLMFRQIERLKEEEKQIAMRKKMEAEARIRECMETQKIIALNKKKKMLEEKEEDLKIQKFNIEKMEREEKLIEEKRRLAIQKEKEIQALREKQEKQKDKLDEMNEIKAKRAAKEAELKEKLKEKEEILKKERLEKEVKECNKKMLELRKKISENEIEKDKEMMEKIRIDNKKVEEEEKIKKKIYLEKLLANKIELEKQIVDKEEREKLKKMKELEEEKKIKKEIDKYLLSLEEIRKQKIQELKDLKIKDAYILPLEKYNYNNIENQNK
jgi:hypothetical protein